MTSIGQIDTEDEGAVGCVGGASICVVVRRSWLAAAVDGEACGDETVGFLFDEHLAAEKDCGRFNVGAGDEFKGFVGVEMFAKLLRDASCDVGDW